MRRAASVAVAVLVALGASGCTSPPDIDFSGQGGVVVDTAELRRLKKEAGVEPCRPGPVSGASDLPSATLPCFAGGPEVDLSSLEGPLVVNLWAQWCGPCRKEMPILEAFYQKYGARVPIIGVDYSDPQADAAMEFVLDTGVTYPLLADTQEKLLGADPFPTLITLPMFAFVRADGSVAIVSELVESVEEMTRLVDEQLGVAL